MKLKDYEWLRPVLFTLDPEAAHNLVYAMLAAASHLSPALNSLRRQYGWQDPVLSQELWGLRFDGPVGVAAGFDKDARAVPALTALGFGFVEVGTLTPRPQPGNPRPRLFRLPADQALVNQMGFNNEGVDAAALRLAGVRDRRAPVGVNLGKNKDTPLDRAFDDYLAGMRRIYRWADYLVINVSSPNTPGLRSLQEGQALGPLLRDLVRANHDTAVTCRTAAICRIPPLPLLLKLAPDLAPSQLEEAVGLAVEAGISGIIATNTTTSREGLISPNVPARGGLSGRPLKSRANTIVAAIRRMVGPKLPIIGVGGIFTGRDAYERIRAGASLVQVYTGFIYRGPAIAGDIARELGLLLRRDGFRNIAEAVGADVPAPPAGSAAADDSASQIGGRQNDHS
ncbi:MAG: quinone-dependent dihydroorotate dehydrogenase [Symbiobacteriia bacterium]